MQMCPIVFLSLRCIICLFIPFHTVGKSAGKSKKKIVFQEFPPISQKISLVHFVNERGAGLSPFQTEMWNPFGWDPDKTSLLPTNRPFYIVLQYISNFNWKTSYTKLLTAATVTVQLKKCEYGSFHDR